MVSHLRIFKEKFFEKEDEGERVEELGRRRPTGSDKTEVETGSHRVRGVIKIWSHCSKSTFFN